jgi:hypothetical protein
MTAAPGIQASQYVSLRRCREQECLSWVSADRHNWDHPGRPRVLSSSTYPTAHLGHNLSNRPSIIQRKAVWRRAAAATIAVLLLAAIPKLHARSRRPLGDSPGTEVRQRVNVTILARGSHVSGSTGNMDSYLVLLSARKNREPVSARLVDYYPGFQHGITDEAITSHRQFRVSVTAAAYCAMDAKAFVVRRAFDPEAIGRIQGNLPCVVVRQWNSGDHALVKPATKVEILECYECQLLSREPSACFC